MSEAENAQTPEVLPPGESPVDEAPAEVLPAESRPPVPGPELEDTRPGGLPFPDDAVGAEVGLAQGRAAADHGSAPAVDISGIELLLVSGMSGAGRSSAAHALEDRGWFVIDNLPPQMLRPTLETIAASGGSSRVAVVVDVRGGRLFDQLRSAISEVVAVGVSLRVLFLEATDEVLIRRFSSTRRPHPLQAGGRLLDGIVAERAVLGDLRARADLVIDTSQRSIHDLRRAIDAAFGGGGRSRLGITVMSFGFKYGPPTDSDFVADARFLPNPFWVPELRPLTGRDAAVHHYVLTQRGADEYVATLARLVELATDGYLSEGKRLVTVAVGCTGGKHRSVAIAEALARRLADTGLSVAVAHRDLGRE